MKKMKKIIFFIILNFLFIGDIFAINLPEKLKKLEYSEDASIQKFVWKHISLNNKNYIPKNLVNIEWKYVSGKGKLRIEAKEELDKMAENFYKTFWKKIVINSAFRDYNYQKNIENKSFLCVKTNFCAKAGFSEHQLWLAVDIFWVNNNPKYYDWLQKNAHKFGFTQSYKNWEKIDWYKIEKWHWRFIWHDLAQKLYENNQTFTQFIFSEEKEKNIEINDNFLNFILQERLTKEEKDDLNKKLDLIFTKNIFELREISTILNTNPYFIEKWKTSPKINYFIEKFNLKFKNIEKN